MANGKPPHGLKPGKEVECLFFVNQRKRKDDMPKLKNDLEEHALPTGSFGYSAAKLEDLGATEYTLVDLVVDVSGSVAAYKDDMEKALQQIIQACKMSPRADNLMVRLVTFSDTLEEIHGYKLLEQCNLNDYNGTLAIRGMTALYDAAENSLLAQNDYAKKLSENDFQANGICFFLTDGCDNQSKSSEKDVGKALKAALKTEALESLVTVLIGVGTKNNPTVSQFLDTFRNGAGLTQFVEVEKADAKTLAKLAEFVSKSISAQSQSLGTGGASTPISLNI
jgi:uncharacterized protein YegL